MDDQATNPTAGDPAFTANYAAAIRDPANSTYTKESLVNGLTGEHSTDFQTMIRAEVSRALKEAGVVTAATFGATFQSDAHVYQRLADSIFEQLRKFLDPKKP